jgi:hypothetical protein
VVANYPHREDVALTLVGEEGGHDWKRNVRRRVGEEQFSSQEAPGELPACPMAGGSY